MIGLTRSLRSLRSAELKVLRAPAEPALSALKLSGQQPGGPPTAAGAAAGDRRLHVVDFGEGG